MSGPADRLNRVWINPRAGYERSVRRMMARPREAARLRTPRAGLIMREHTDDRWFKTEQRATLGRSLAERLARTAGILSRATGAGSGTNVPGRILERLSPQYVADRAATLQDGVVVVSGTNGKTTTASMIRDILGRQGYTVVSNQSGGNLGAGIASALLAAPSSASIGVFEVDEAALPHMIPMLRPKVLVLTNVFRDQLDRFGEPERVVELLREAESLLPPGARVVANVDDSAMWEAVADADPIGFGVVLPANNFRPSPKAGPGPTSQATAASEPETCPACAGQLTVLRRAVANLGSFECDRCGWGSAWPDYRAVVRASGGLSGTIFELRGILVTLPVGGIHNVYDAAAAVAAAGVLGIPPVRSIAALEYFEPRFGRAEVLEVDGRPVWLALIKNPAGAGMVIEEVASDPTIRVAVISVSDRPADGRDISWIWDTDFEWLVARGIALIPSGRRAADVAVRLKYAGAASMPALADPVAAVRAAQACDPGGAMVAVLATYTAMLDVRSALARGRVARVVDHPVAFTEPAQ